MILIVLLFPFDMGGYNDGGTSYFYAIFYSLTFWHKLDDNYKSGYYEATEFKIFPFNWFKHINYVRELLTSYEK